MTQRVKIQYTVAIEELEHEVERLVTKAFDKLKSTINKYPSNKNVLPLSLQMIDGIDEVRLSLSEVDYALQDVTDIVSSYVSFRSTPQPTSADPEVDVNSELLNKMNEFKKMIAANELSNEISD